MKNTVDRPVAASAFADSKPHYAILDGLRGVAALVVIWYHVFEGFATSPLDQKFNHGYLAVDFFFILSGFVVGYAYDDRWKGRPGNASGVRGGMRIRDFLKRRLIRLHPMVVLGSVLGAVTFLIQGSVQWNGTQVPFGAVMLAMLLGIFLIPAYPGAPYEVRGNNEMYPLNGPSWSLFFEYIGNILYALVLRRLSTRWLSVVVAVSGLGLAGYAVGGLSGFGHLGVGWSLTDLNLPGGFLRLMFSFGVGLLMSRGFRPWKVRGAFWICSAAVILLLSAPRIGGEANMWLNGLYEAVCVICIFPLLVYIGASGRLSGPVSGRVCKFLGDISYPVYMIHYPFMYLFYSWTFTGVPFSEAWPWAVTVFLGSIVLAYIVLKVYDEPLRRWLGRKWLLQVR